MRFVYVRPEIVDRNPTPGVAHLQDGLIIAFSIGNVVPHLDVTEYPAPPSGMVVNPGSDVEAMFDKWSRYKAFVDLRRRHHWVLEPYRYASQERLIADLSEQVIAPAEAKTLELRGVSPPT